MKSLKIFAATAALTIAAALIPAKAGILTGVDILNLSGVTESSLADFNMTTARNQLLAAGATITDLPIGSFTAANLAGIDILYAGLVNGSFSAAQITDINNYVAGGGGLVAVGTERVCCFGPPWEQIANSYGLVGLGGDRFVKASPADPLSPIVNGPFGVAGTYAPSATGAFSPTLPAGANIVWEGVDNNPVIVTLNVTGRAFFFADTNFMEDFYIANGDNAIIWGNAFAFTGQVQPAPEPGTLALFGIAIMGAAAARSRKR